MKLQKHIKQIIPAILLQIYTIHLVECTVRKYLNNTTPVTTSIVEIKEKNELIKSNISLNATQKSDLFIYPHVHEKNKNPQTPEDIPDSVTTGFYILMGAGLIGLGFIIYKAFRLRMSRAERRYGVQGDRSAQELTPLPIAIDEDSDNEDQTIFERNHP